MAFSDCETALSLASFGLVFSANGAYPEMCEQAVRDLHVAENGDCDANCDDQIEVATANLLTSALVRRTKALGAAGATALLIDITHNGGGSNWVEAPPRALSSVSLRDSKMAFIKHEHWTKQLQDRLRDVQTDIRNRADSPVLWTGQPVSSKEQSAKASSLARQQRYGIPDSSTALCWSKNSC